MERSELVGPEPAHIVPRIPIDEFVAVTREKADLHDQGQVKFLFEQCRETHVRIVAPDSRLHPQVLFIIRSQRDIYLRYERVDADMRERSEGVLELGLAHEVALLDVALEAHREAIERDLGIGLDIFQDGDGACRLRVVAACARIPQYKTLRSWEASFPYPYCSHSMQDGCQAQQPQMQP